MLEFECWVNLLHLSGGTNGEVVLSMTASSTVPIPAAVWLFGSGLFGLIGMARRKKAA